MAVEPRRTYDLLRAEHIRRAGRFSQASYSARAEEFITAAVFEIATQWHHYELDKEDATLTASIGSEDIALPPDAWGIFSFDLKAVGGAYVATLNWQHAHSLLRGFTSTNGRPDRFTRFGNNLKLSRPADIAYETTLYYYQKPTAPDFGGGTASPPFGREWDEIILDYSLWLARPALWRPDLAGQVGARLEKWYESSAQTLLRDAGLYGAPERRTMDFPHAGGQS